MTQNIKKVKTNKSRPKGDIVENQNTFSMPRLFDDDYPDKFFTPLELRKYEHLLKDKFFVGEEPLDRPREKKLKKGGKVKKRVASKRVKVTRGDGIAKRGKTRGRMV